MQDNYTIPNGFIKPSLESLVKTVTSISALPAVSMQIIQLAKDPESSVHAMEQLIATDGALTAAVLKFVNSAALGLPSHVTDIHKAIVILGFKTIRDIALATSVCPLFQKPFRMADYTRAGLWKHCISVAIAARMIVRRVQDSADDSMFTLGVLHDLGILLLDQYCNQWFEVILRHPRYKQDGFDSIERELVGFCHQDMAAEVLRKWGMPVAVTEPIGLMAAPSRSRNFPRQSAMLFLANSLVCRSKVGYCSNRSVQADEFNFCLRILNLSAHDIQVFREDLPNELQDASGLLSLVEDLN